MKNPNGYGSVVKLSGKRRKPFAVRKTVGFNQKGHPIYNVIGYASTREEGLILLAKYNGNPWDVDAVKITFEELFELWKEKKSHKLSSSNQGSLKAGYRHCFKIHKMKYKDIKSYHMQECIDKCGKSPSTEAIIRNLLKHLDAFAFEIDVINKCYSSLLIINPQNESEKRPFSPQNIGEFWGLYKEGVFWVDVVLIFCYTGFRISELLNLTIENVNLTDNTLKGGTKTNAGKNRIIPIHSKIHPIIEKLIEKNKTHLIEIGNKQVTTNTCRNEFYKVMNLLNIEYTPHECRHTFRTFLDAKGANKRCIDLLMGHKSKDVGERVYTHKTIEELKETIELLD